MSPLATLAQQLAAQQIAARDLVEGCLARIEDPAGQGAKTSKAIPIGDSERALSGISRIPC
jgi:hypothetical protein